MCGYVWGVCVLCGSGVDTCVHMGGHVCVDVWMCTWVGVYGRVCVWTCTGGGCVWMDTCVDGHVCGWTMCVDGPCVWIDSVDGHLCVDGHVWVDMCVDGLCGWAHVCGWTRVCVCVDGHAGVHVCTGVCCCSCRGHLGPEQGAGRGLCVTHWEDDRLCPGRPEQTPPPPGAMMPWTGWFFLKETKVYVFT